MNQKHKTAINPTRQEDYPEWYQQVIKAADLAEHSAVRGCMVIKPWGYAIWENVQKVLDRMFKETGHVNACFPLLIPLSFLEKEATHVEGFAKECAVVTHHRLESDGHGKLKPAGALEEPYVIRPTSETIIGHSFSKWVQSYRDLPILINQWANVMRWEMRTRLFLRTSEFFWQEGHTVHETKEEAVQETLKMLDVYEDFATNWAAIPVIKGAKTSDERFPGAEDTYTVEAMMQDGKALQAGTSHFLGQNFAKASNISFLDRQGQEQYAWTTSWGMSTRIIGGLIMTHSDDDGLVLPPALAPYHVVIMPIYRNDEEKAKVLDFCQRLKKELQEKTYMSESVRVLLDDRDIRGGEKAWQYIKKGVPLRVEVGPRDIASSSVFLARRDKAHNDKSSYGKEAFVAEISAILTDMQEAIKQRAATFRDQKIVLIDSLEDFKAFFDDPQAGFASCHWNEAAIGHGLFKELKVTPRCIPLSAKEESGRCIFTGQPSQKRVLFGRSY